MKKAKIVFLSLTAASAVLFMNACTKDKDNTKFYVNTPFTAAQTIPASNATSSGTLEATYDRATKTVSYKVSWANLMDTATTLHVHGLADSGAVALSPGIIQTFTRTTTPALPTAKVAGSFSANLFVDGVLIKEEDMLAGKYYIDLHTKAKPNGELRGQLKFNSQ